MRRSSVGLALSILGAALITGSVLAQSRPPALPVDLNQASLRISALDTLYEFDLAPEQLRALKAAATKTASAQRRTPVKANAEMARAFADFQGALLTSKDDAAISKLRNHIVELGSDLELDDDVQPTDAALAQAPAVCRQLKASQIAAFLASHADQVADPEELMVSSLDGIRDTRAEGGANGAAEAAGLVTDTAVSVSYLVFGADDAKAKPLATQISAWLNSAAGLDDKDFTAQQPAREAAAKKLIGDVDPMVVLSHWLGLQVAQLLSNPELPAAIDAILVARAAQK
jgi:hypothetical protein